MQQHFTMKSMKSLKVNPIPWNGDRALHFFNELAHGIARSFMVNSLVWRLPMHFRLGVSNHAALPTEGPKCQLTAELDTLAVL